MTEPKEETPIEVSNLATALCKAQGEMSGAGKNKENPFHKSSYADLGSVIAAIREPFSSNGLSVTQTMEILENGRSVMSTTLMHVGGQHVSSKMLLPEEVNPQKMGTNITYYRRYMLMAICNLAPVDDDANSVTLLQPRHVTALNKLLEGHDLIKAKVLGSCNGKIESMTLDRFPGAVQWINEMIEEAKNV